ncbi:hypothetical protein SAMN05444716_1223 [Streptomyces harbinensis]|uniref:MFS transporter n=2 Tax=Streptomyces harbinensis TaxID=1176198 RepID=A0A1I6WDA1_9ACTN|nr:hypothetical protein SAMN05444716_1223 [Streptomyces harbinensis]
MRRLLVVLGTAAMLAALSLTALPSATADPRCEILDGTARDFCEDGGGGGGGGSADPADRCELLATTTRVWCERGAAMDWGSLTDCKAPPTPARPDAGMHGWFGGVTPASTSGPVDPADEQWQSRLYEQYGMGGLKWHTYDTGCVGGVGAWGETGMANMVFDWGKWWTGLGVALQRESTNDGFTSGLSNVFEDATINLGAALYAPWLPVSVGLLGVAIVFRARKKETAGILTAVGWAGVVIALASAVLAYPRELGAFADEAITGTVGAVQQALTVDGTAAGDQSAAAVAQGNLIQGNILYDRWLSGALGSTDSATAQEYGPVLLDAQALTWTESALPDEQRQEVVRAKQQAWVALADHIQETDPEAYGYLTGNDASRFGEAALAGIAVIPANLFAIATGFVLAAALLILRMAVMFVPVLAPIALHQRTAGPMKTLGKSVGAALVNAPLFAVAAGVNVWLIRAILDPDNGISMWFGIVLIYVVAAMLWGMTRPLRRMTSMVSPNQPFMADGMGVLGKGKAAVAGGVIGYAKGRMNARHLKKYFDQLRPGDAGRGPETTEEARPEEGADVSAGRTSTPPRAEQSDGARMGGDLSRWQHAEREDEAPWTDTTITVERDRDSTADAYGGGDIQVWRPARREQHEEPDPTTPYAPAGGHTTRSSGASADVRVAVDRMPRQTRPAAAETATPPRVPAPPPRPALTPGSSSASTAQPSQPDAPQPSAGPRVVTPEATEDGPVFVIYRPSTGGYDVTGTGTGSTPDEGGPRA